MSTGPAQSATPGVHTCRPQLPTWPMPCKLSHCAEMATPPPLWGWRWMKRQRHDLCGMFHCSGPPDAAPLLRRQLSDYLPFPTVTDLTAAEEGDLRIISRVDINGFATGALQVFHNGAFGAVCNNQFSAVDADVACRQLGFTGGTSLPLALDRDLSVNQQRALVEVWSGARCCSSVSRSRGAGRWHRGLERAVTRMCTPTQPHRDIDTGTETSIANASVCACNSFPPSATVRVPLSAQLMH